MLLSDVNEYFCEPLPVFTLFIYNYSPGSLDVAGFEHHSSQLDDNNTIRFTQL